MVVQQHLPAHRQETGTRTQDGLVARNEAEVAEDCGNGNGTLAEVVLALLHQVEAGTVWLEVLLLENRR